MPTFRYNKLVRDKIVEGMIKDGEMPEYRTLDYAEYLLALRDKIIEEAQEIQPADNKQNLLKELADIQEVIDCMRDALGATPGQINTLQQKKTDKAGSFKKRLFVSRTSPDPGNPWVDYLRKHPDRYPEETS